MKPAAVPISVVVPIYNAARYLAQCLESLTEQTLPNIEIICIDDGSTDASAGIVKSFMSRSSNVRLLRQRNMTAGAARNVGLKLARGEYVYFADADDFFDLTLAECAYLAAMRANADIAIFQFRVFHDKQQRVRNTVWGIEVGAGQCVRNPFCILDLPDGKFEFTDTLPGNKIFRREFLEAHGIMFEVRRSLNDLRFSWEALAKADRIFLLRKVLMYYRVSTGVSLTDLGYMQAFDVVAAFQQVEQVLRRASRWPLVRLDFKLAQFRRWREFAGRLSRLRGTLQHGDQVADYERHARAYVRRIQADLDGSFRGFETQEVDAIHRNSNYQFLRALTTEDLLDPVARSRRSVGDASCAT